MAMTDSFDAPMMDFSGEDIPMQTSSSTSWIHPEATMDDDSNFNLDDVEIDMDNALTETFEYEMTDDSSAEQPIEVHDVEVIDVSQAHTPALIDTVVEDATAASPAVPEHDLIDTHDRSPLESPPTLVIQVPSPTPQPAQDEEDHGIPVAESLSQSEWDQDRSEPPAAFASPHLVERRQSQTPAEPASVEGATEPTPIQNIGTPVEQLQLESSHEKLPYDLSDRWVEEENPVSSHASSGDPHEVSDGIFIDPPPPVILSLGDSEEEYYLFNCPTHKSPTADDGRTTDDALFLHDLPTLYYEPLAKAFQALRSDDRLAQLFDLSRGELVIDAYDLVDLVISEDNSYTNEVSFHDLNFLHDHADLAGPLRVRVGCNPRRFIARYRELKSKLEQFNLLDDAGVDDTQPREHYGLTEQLGVHDGQEYLAQDEAGNENPTTEGHDQATTEQQTDDAGSATHAVDRFDEGESLNDTEPEQAQPAGDEESTVGPLSGDETTEQPIGVAEDGHDHGTSAATGSDSGYPGPTEDPDATAVHEHSYDFNTPPSGGNPAGYEEVVVTNEDYEADYNENDQDSEHGELVAIEGDARDVDWETTASYAQHTQDEPEQHESQDDAGGTDNHPSTIDVTTLNPEDDHIAAQQDTDTDSIGQRTLNEFADAQAQEETRGDHSPHAEGEESNSTTDQSNELNVEPDQFGDDFNWDEDFGGDFGDGEFGELEAQNDLETKRVDPQEPTSGRSSKRGFDEIDSDTADEEETQGDMSPNSKRKKVL